MARNLLLVIMALCLLAAADVARTPAFERFEATRRYQDVYYLPPSDWLLLGSLGYRESLASLVWIKALVNFGEEMAHRGKVKHFFDYADAILALDPDFRRVYRWAGLLALYRPGANRKEDALRAVDFLERGLSRFPDDGEMAWDLGATYAYEFPPIFKDDSAMLEKAKRLGAQYLLSASLLGGGPDWAGLNAASTLTKLGESEQAMRHLMEIYTTVDEPAAKAEIEARLQEVRSENFILAMREADRQLAEARRDYPYLPTTLFLLVGRRKDRDEAALLERNFDPAFAQAQGPDEEPVLDP